MWAIRSFDTFWRNVVRAMNDAKRAPPNAEDSLLPDTHPHVQKVLSSKLGKSPGGWEPGTVDIHQKHYASKGIRFGTLKPDQDTSSSPWHSTLSAREKDVCVFTRAFHPGKHAVDVGQSIYRSVHSSEVRGAIVGPTSLPGSKVWWFSRCRLQTGLESFAMTGFPIVKYPDLIEKYSDEFLADLAGNAFSGTIIVALVGILTALLPWTDSDREEEEQDSSADTSDVEQEAGVSQAMAALQRLKRKPAVAAT